MKLHGQESRVRKSWPGKLILLLLTGRGGKRTARKAEHYLTTSEKTTLTVEGKQPKSKRIGRTTQLKYVMNERNLGFITQTQEHEHQQKTIHKLPALVFLQMFPAAFQGLHLLANTQNFIHI